MKKIILTISLLALMALLAACSGPQGQPGEIGPPGPPGPEGPQGPAGVSAATEENDGGGAAALQNDYSGDTTCQGCHSEIYNAYIQSGHPWILNRVEGQTPDLPFTNIGERPAGYAWEDILYVVGGYNWKALFVNDQGYLITNPPDAVGETSYANQYNLPNPALGQDDDLVGFHSGEENKPYDCGGCHTTGYNPVTSNELPGVVGTWAQEGVRCEECHGPGSLHASDPTRHNMEIERDAGACQSCHPMAGVPDEAIGSGFIDHREAYGDLFPGKHALLDCVDCHDPHSGVIAHRKANEPTTRAQCGDCHYEYVGRHKVPEHTMMQMTCTDCHMPRIIRVASGEPRLFTADMRTHQVAINPQQLGQFTEDATEVLPQVGLNYACRRCHLPGTSIERADEELIQAATGYHAVPQTEDNAEGPTPNEGAATETATPAGTATP